MLCNISQNAMGQLGGYPARSSRGGTLARGYPPRGTLARGYPGWGGGTLARGVPWPGGTLARGYPGRGGTLARGVPWLGVHWLGGYPGWGGTLPGGYPGQVPPGQVRMGGYPGRTTEGVLTTPAGGMPLAFTQEYFLVTRDVDLSLDIFEFS